MASIGPTETGRAGHRLCVALDRVKTGAIVLGALLGTVLLSGLASCSNEPPPAENDLTGA